MTFDLKQIEERTTSLEEDMKQMVSVVNETNRSVATIGTNMEHMQSSVTAIFRKFEQQVERQKTPWGTLISFGSLLALIIGAILAPFHFRISTLEDEINQLQDRVVIQADQNGYERAQLEHLINKNVK